MVCLSEGLREASKDKPWVVVVLATGEWPSDVPSRCCWSYQLRFELMRVRQWEHTVRLVRDVAAFGHHCHMVQLSHGTGTARRRLHSVISVEGAVCV
jgi:hypothetical protein